LNATGFRGVHKRGCTLNRKWDSGNCWQVPGRVTGNLKIPHVRLERRNEAARVVRRAQFHFFVKARMR
jgi:hypothetical protein